jgi:tetratricopeptide (TPR) repeat protein
VLAREAGCSHTTVSAVFSSPKLPSWGVLELLVEAMDGDVGEFHRLWLEASAPTGSAPSAAPRIAGRKAELAAVRRHLEAGTGLLLVAGEAGIGKTKLVDTARATTDVFVASGNCLPLSTQVALLPITDALRAVYEPDTGRRLKEALVDCPTYVPMALQRLLPELDAIEADAAPVDDQAQQRLFSAIDTVLTRLAATQPLAVVVEDLHWADSATLDLLEYLLARGQQVPLVGSWRLDDPSTPTTSNEWWVRVRRHDGVSVVELGALTDAETKEQVALISSATPSDDLVERIYTRSQGNPLFTEQLSIQAESSGAAQTPMPRLLADVLDQRLEGLPDQAWQVARILSVADRPLGAARLREVTGLAGDASTSALRELDRRRLTAPTGPTDDVRLRHPLLAEAIRRRLVTSEEAEVHRRLATVMSAWPEATAAEVAEHWRLAADRSEELVWRVRAARAAGQRLALAHEGEEWIRALELWPDCTTVEHTSRVDAYVAAIETLQMVDLTTAEALATEALGHLGDPASMASADLYQVAADVRGALGDAEGGLALVDRAIEIYEATGPSRAQVRALNRRDWLLDQLGRFDEAADTGRRAMDLCNRLDEPALYRSLLVREAYHEVDAGRLDGALEHLSSAAQLELPEPDPQGDIELAVAYTDILIEAGHSADEVVEAARPGLEAAHAWGLDTVTVAILHGNVSGALRFCGHVDRAAALIDPLTDGVAPTLDHWAIHDERAILDAVRGRCAEAARRYDLMIGLRVSGLSNRMDSAECAATADLWCGRPQAALERLMVVLREAVTTDASAMVGGMLVLAARAAADLSGSTGTREGLLADLLDLRERCTADPFLPDPASVTRSALAASWAAETARLAGRPEPTLWAAAAAEWDSIGRPHDAAYCRWRAAQTVIGHGQRTVADKLLRRAARDAREHVPLLAAIRHTSKGA